MGHWRERSSSTNVDRVQIPNAASHVALPSLLLILLPFLKSSGFSVFRPPQDLNNNLISKR